MTEPPKSGTRLELVLKDLAHAARSLARTPAVTTIVVLTLALGIGMNAAIFGVVDAVLLTPLGFRDAESVVELVGSARLDGEERSVSFSARDVAEARDLLDSMEDLAAVASIRQNLSGAGLPRQVDVGWVSANLFDLLGVEPALGRTFLPDDPPGTALLAEEYWHAELGSDPEILGRSVRLDGHPYTVVGVVPAGFSVHVARIPDRIQVWKNPDAFWQNGDVWGATDIHIGFFRVIGRTRDDATPARLAAETERLTERLRELTPEYEAADLGIRVVSLQERVAETVRPTLVLLSGAVALLLLIACANVSSLLLARTQERSGELAVRLALGSSRRRMLSLLLLESGLLALAGSIAGLALGAGTTGVLKRMAPPLPRVDALGMDTNVLAFTFAVGALATLLVGTLPALRALRSGTTPVLSARGGSVRAGGRGARAALVVGQLALALVLLVGSGLLTRALIRLQSVDPGFDEERLLTFAVSLPGTRYTWPQETGRFLHELQDRIAALPGVRDAGVMWPIPLEGSTWGGPYRTPDTPAGEEPRAGYRVGTSAYFSTMGIPLLEGRLFEESDPREVVVVSRSVAERAWPGTSAVGRTLSANPWGGGDTRFEVVGVVEDVRTLGLDEDPDPALYFHARGWSWADWEFHYVVRTEGPPDALVPTLREIVASMDAEAPLATPASMATLVSHELAPNRFALALIGLFSVVAGTLALVGLYGLVSFSVSVRSHEIGIRMALGSAGAAVARLLVLQGMRLVAAGLALGLAGAYLVSGLLDTYLFEVRATDPATYAGVAVALALCALVATWIPANRAARTEPMKVLRSD